MDKSLFVSTAIEMSFSLPLSLSFVMRKSCWSFVGCLCVCVLFCLLFTECIHSAPLSLRQDMLLCACVCTFPLRSLFSVVDCRLRDAFFPPFGIAFILFTPVRLAFESVEPSTHSVCVRLPYKPSCRLSDRSSLNLATQANRPTNNLGKFKTPLDTSTRKKNLSVPIST